MPPTTSPRGTASPSPTTTSAATSASASFHCTVVPGPDPVCEIHGLACAELSGELEDGRVDQLLDERVLRRRPGRQRGLLLVGSRPISEIPDPETLEEWQDESDGKALDGCWVEPDGTSEHGKPSWLLVLGYV
jgi:hypothetical protein